MPVVAARSPRAAFGVAAAVLVSVAGWPIIASAIALLAGAVVAPAIGVLHAGVRPSAFRGYGARRLRRALAFQSSAVAGRVISAGYIALPVTLVSIVAPTPVVAVFAATERLQRMVLTGLQSRDAISTDTATTTSTPAPPVERGRRHHGGLVCERDGTRGAADVRPSIRGRARGRPTSSRARDVGIRVLSEGRLGPSCVTHGPTSPRRTSGERVNPEVKKGGRGAHRDMRERLEPPEGPRTLRGCVPHPHRPVEGLTATCANDSSPRKGPGH